MNAIIKLFCVCGLAVMLTACQDSTTELLSNLPENEANMIVSVLASASIPATKSREKDGTSSIYVASEKQSEALSKLRQRGLPRTSYTSLGDMFKKDSIVSSPLEEQARYVYALAQELEKTLSALDGVVYVRVHPVLARKSSLNNPSSGASAGVLITHRPDVDLKPLTPQIQALVAHSIPDLDSAKVSVVMTVSEDMFNDDDVILHADNSISTTRWQLLAMTAIALLIAMLAYGLWRNKTAREKMLHQTLELHE